MIDGEFHRRFINFNFRIDVISFFERVALFVISATTDYRNSSMKMNRDVSNWRPGQVGFKAGTRLNVAGEIWECADVFHPLYLQS